MKQSVGGAVGKKPSLRGGTTKQSPGGTTDLIAYSASLKQIAAVASLARNDDIDS